jgi:hypothetical protein
LEGSPAGYSTARIDQGGSMYIGIGTLILIILILILVF